MATRLTLLESTRRIIDEETAANSHFTDDEIYDYLNQAIRILGTETEWPLQTAEATSVEDQAVYTLPTDFVSLSDIYFNDFVMTIVDRTDLAKFRQDWQNAESAAPNYAYRADNAKIGLWPPPDAANSGKTIQIQYVKVPPDLSDDTTAPDLHVTFNDCLPFYAAFLCEHKMGNSKRSDLNLKLYEDHKRRLLSKVQRFSDSLLQFRWSGQGY